MYRRLVAWCGSWRWRGARRDPRPLRVSRLLTAVPLGAGRAVACVTSLLSLSPSVGNYFLTLKEKNDFYVSHGGKSF